MPAKIAPEKRALARQLWESGKSKAAIARTLDVSVNTIRSWSKKDQWSEPQISVPEGIVEAFEGRTETVAEDDPRLAELRRQLEEERARSKKLEEDASSTKEVHVYTTPEEVVDWFGEQAIRDRVDREFGSMNIERARQGLPPLDPETVAPEIYREIRRKLLQDLLDRRTKWVDPGAKLRVMKVVHPNGNLVELGVEDQFNNEKGMAGASVLHYRRKGFKLAVPYFCQRNACWMYAAQENGQFLYDGYCSPAHRADFAVPRQGGQGPLITTRDMQGV